MKAKLRRDLPNSCAISAVAESWLRLRESGAPSRIMAMVFRDGESHAATVFQSPDGNIFIYDPLKGSRRLSGLSMDSPPLRIARRVFGSRIVSARWIKPPEDAQPKIHGRNRRLSPRECRAFVPSFDRLLAEQSTI